MKTPLKFMFLVMAVAGLCFGCDDENSEPKAPVAVRFELLNEAGEPTTTFKEGEDILFRMRIENQSDRDISLLSFEPNNNELFQVKRWEKLSDTSPEMGWVFINSPVELVVQTVYIHGYTIPSESSFDLILSWVGNKELSTIPPGWRADLMGNPHLKPGNFKVDFPFKMKFHGFSIIEKEVDLDFVISE